MANASDYVSGGSVNWTRLVRNSVGTVVLAYFMYLARALEFFLGGIQTGITRLGGWLEELVTALVTLPLPGMQSAMYAAADGLAPFGIAGYVVGVLIVALTLLVAVEALAYVSGWS